MTLVAAIADATGIRIDASGMHAVSGGSINTAARLQSDAGPLFLKTNRAERYEMFAAEAEGLAELAAADAVRVPRVQGCGTHGRQAWLLLEFLELGPATGPCRRRLGKQLAELHRHTSARHGWHRDNTIGSTPQPNSPEGDWVVFLRDQRIGFQLGLAAQRGFGRELAGGERLLERLDDYFAGYTPLPSLLHGDLWGGNFGAVDDEPVIFDPAVYYGDRESDLAMTELFGGFGADFYAAYGEAWPLDPGYAVRRDLYQLYHVLNHLNLFGGGYLGQARRLIDRLLTV